MTHSKTPVTVITATPEVEKVIDDLRAYKRAQKEKLRNMKTEDITRRILL